MFSSMLLCQQNLLAGFPKMNSKLRLSVGTSISSLQVFSFKKHLFEVVYWLRFERLMSA